MGLCLHSPEELDAAYSEGRAEANAEWRALLSSEAAKANMAHAVSLALNGGPLSASLKLKSAAAVAPPAPKDPREAFERTLGAQRQSIYDRAAGK